MQQIEQQVIQNYTNNLEYLKNNHKDLFDRITLLSNAIDTGVYAPRYELEYITEDQEFDIYDTHTKTYIYNKQPSKFIQEAVSQIKLDRSGAVISLNPQLHTLKQKQNSENLTIKHMQDYFKYIQIDTNKKFKYIQFFVFLDSMLGIHIEKIDQIVLSNQYLIQEKNLEIFRLSLFTTSYYQLAKEARLTFSIMEDIEIFKNKLYASFLENIQASYMVKYHCVTQITNYIDAISQVVMQLSPFDFPYDRVLYELFERDMQYIQKYNILDLSKKHNLFSNFPVLFIGAGPSLDHNILWLKQHQDKFVIVSIGAAVKLLVKHNIKIDLIINLDGKKVIKSKQFPDEIIEQIKHIPFLASVNSHPLLLEAFELNNIFLYEAMIKIKDTSINIDGYSVGEVGFHLCYYFGANTIYMLGTDLSLDTKTGATHSNTHNDSKNISSKEQLQQTVALSYNVDADTIYKVKGNFQTQVSTTQKFFHSIKAYEEIISNIKQQNNNVAFYNLNNGAYINGTQPLHTDQISLQPIEQTLDIKSYLQQNSTNNLTQNEIDKLLDSVSYTNQIITVVEQFEKRDLTNYEDFAFSRNDFIKLIHNNQSLGILNKILIDYTRICEPIIHYGFNDQNLKNESKLINKIKTIWVSHIKEICNEYIKIIQDNLKLN